MAHYIPLNILMQMNYAILDIEFIQLSKERNNWPGNPPPGKKAGVHQCLRKSAILDYGDRLRVWNARPCLDLKRHLMWGEERHFYWCQKNIHGLSYYPNKGFNLCENMIENFRRYIQDRKIEIILHKGGNVEIDVAEKLGIPYVNIEIYGVSKARSHIPEEEIREYKEQLREMYERM